MSFPFWKSEVFTLFGGYIHTFRGMLPFLHILGILLWVYFKNLLPHSDWGPDRTWFLAQVCLVTASQANKQEIDPKQVNVCRDISNAESL